jgi:signal transduction histidine kinase
MAAIIHTIHEAEDFIKNLKRSDNWVSNQLLFDKLRRCEELINNHQREDLIPYLGVNFTLYYLDIGKFEDAWKYTEETRKYADKYNNTESTLNAISLQYRIQRYFGNYDVAQEIINQQIEIAYNTTNLPHLFSAYLNQATLYQHQMLKEECIESFEKSVEYALKSKNQYFICLAYINFGGNLIEFNELEKAKINLDKGNAIAKKNSFINMLALAHSNYGLYFQKTNDGKRSEKHFKNCIELYDSIHNLNEGIQAKIMLVDAYEAFNKIEMAEKILKEVKDFSERHQQKVNLVSIYKQLSTLNEKKEDYKNSLHYYKKHKQINEEIQNTETDKKIRNLEFLQKLNILKIEKDSAEKMANIKHDFLANMSHEIRTPINSIMGICYLLQQRQLDEMSFNYVNRLKRSGENLLGIINDVLDISKIESGKMELVYHPFSLNALLQDILHAIEPKAIEKNINFSINKKHKEDIQLIGDAVRLQQILINLVSNAIKFTEKGSVTLQISTNENNDQSLEIKFNVIDTGIGIPKDKIDKIFERYEQASATIKTTFGGTGLGLSISKKMIELMDGTIEIKSKLGKGSQFTVTIPFQNATQQTTTTINKTINAEQLNYKHILIADDNIENRLVAKEVLLSFNKTIIIYETDNGKDVLDILSKQKIDIIFLDLDMPILNGFETLHKIRKNKKYNALKIIGNTASLSTMSKEDFLELGFNDFIYKPYKPEEFITSICK